MSKADDTRERILRAAMKEFSAYGVAGARVDRIAKTAGCNKNLIYVYFESKEALFTTVLRQHLLRVYEELEFSADDLPGYATRVFDFAMAHPDLMRLMAWSNLEPGAHNPAERAAAHDVKVAEVVTARDAGRQGTALPSSFLLTAIMVLATAWSAVSPFGLPVDPGATGHRAQLRDNIAEAVRLLASAKNLSPNREPRRTARRRSTANSKPQPVD